MRSFRHWSPRYLFDRSNEKIYRLLHPGLPWLTPQANQILESWIRPGDAGLEFGSGRSTLWFSARAGTLLSVEHNPDWYHIVTAQLEAQGRKNVNYHLKPKDEAGKTQPAYVEAALELADNSIDFILVDGIYRDLCAVVGICKLRVGGILIIDNVNHYLPSASMAPNSVPRDGVPDSQVWQEVYQTLRTWRTIWTSNGISDTAIFVKS